MQRTSHLRPASLFLALLMAVLAACTVAPQEAADSGSGPAAPDFRLANAAGGETGLSDYDGTPVLLFFHMAAG